MNLPTGYISSCARCHRSIILVELETIDGRINRRWYPQTAGELVDCYQRSGFYCVPIELEQLA